MYGSFSSAETELAKKQRILRENVQRGKRAELLVKTSIGRFGDKVTKVHKRRDLGVERKELFTGKANKG